MSITSQAPMLNVKLRAGSAKTRRCAISILYRGGRKCWERTFCIGGRKLLPEELVVTAGSFFLRAEAGRTQPGG